LSKYFAVDLGTSLTKISDKSRKKYLIEPTIAAIDMDSSKLVAFGSDALSAIEAKPGRVKIFKPVRHGQIEDLNLGAQIVSCVLRKAGHTKFGRSYVLVSTYGDSTKVQQRAMARSLKEAGVHEVRFLESAIAASVDLSLPIGEPVGNMIVILGAGRCEAAVLSLGSIVTSTSLAVGATDIDSSLKNHFIRKYNINVSTLLCSHLRENITRDNQDSNTHTIVGYDISSGENVSVDVRAVELWGVIDDVLSQIIQGITQVLTSTPPDITNDLCQSGVHVIGGLARLDGLEGMLANAMELPVHTYANPETHVIGGLRKSLSHFSDMTKA
jgi:rod shape-determining protein MreB